MAKNPGGTGQRWEKIANDIGWPVEQVGRQLENKRQQFVLLSYVARPASTTPNMDTPDNYQTTYDSKTKIVIFYSVNIYAMGCKT